MQYQTREQREHQLVALMLSNRAALNAAYAVALNLYPAPEMTDRDVIEAILGAEYPQTEAPPKPR